MAGSAQDHGEETQLTPADEASAVDRVKAVPPDGVIGQGSGEATNAGDEKTEATEGANENGELATSALAPADITITTNTDATDEVASPVAGKTIADATTAGGAETTNSSNTAEGVATEVDGVASLVPLVLTLTGTVEGARCLRAMVFAGGGIGSAVQAAILRQDQQLKEVGGAAGVMSVGIRGVVRMLVRLSRRTCEAGVLVCSRSRRGVCEGTLC